MFADIRTGLRTGIGVDGVDHLLIYQQYLHGTLNTGGAAVSFLASKLRVSKDSVYLRTRAQGQVAHHVFLMQKIVCRFRCFP